MHRRKSGATLDGNGMFSVRTSEADDASTTSSVEPVARPRINGGHSHSHDDHRSHSHSHSHSPTEQSSHSHSHSHSAGDHSHSHSLPDTTPAIVAPQRQRVTSSPSNTPPPPRLSNGLPHRRTPSLQPSRNFQPSLYTNHQIPQAPRTAGPYQSGFDLSSTTIPEAEGAGLDFNGWSPTSASAPHHRSHSSSALHPRQHTPTSPLSPPRSPRLLVPPRSPSLPSPDAPDFPSSRGAHNRHHSRIHSRNLSVFFPRPGANTSMQQSISEDDGQDVEYNGSAGETLISSPAITSGFRFGSKNPESLTPPRTGTNGSSAPKRRGHHHKHSVSHNFFSFMQPTASSLAHQSHAQAQASDSPYMNGSSSLPTRSSPSLNGSSLPTPSTATFAPTQLEYVDVAPGTMGSIIAAKKSGTSNAVSNGTWTKAFALGEFLLGGALWVEGQRMGSLACTGLGYWVMSDAAGVYLSVSGAKMRSEPRSIRKPFGSRRVETVALFVQSIYLVFAGVYMCKEAVEHLLLAGGGPSEGDSHHHHAAEEVDLGYPPMMYPTTILWLCLASFSISSLFFNNNEKLLEATGNHLPHPLQIPSSLSALFPSAYRRQPNGNFYPPRSKFLRMYMNPFSSAPILFVIAILGAYLFVDPSQQFNADLIIATLETVLTFMIANPTATALGKVLLQTAPDRGMPGGQMEAFLRFMRELEHHPQIEHLPAPHLWQLTPVAPASKPLLTSSTRARKHHEDDDDVPDEGSLVATLQLHVKREVGDDDILELTRMVWERCSKALGSSGAGITVSVVRG